METINSTTTASAYLLRTTQYMVVDKLGVSPRRRSLPVNLEYKRSGITNVASAAKPLNYTILMSPPNLFTHRWHLPNLPQRLFSGWFAAYLRGFET